MPRVARGGGQSTHCIPALLIEPVLGVNEHHPKTRGEQVLEVNIVNVGQGTQALVITVQHLVVPLLVVVVISFLRPGVLSVSADPRPGCQQEHYCWLTWDQRLQLPPPHRRGPPNP